MEIPPEELQVLWLAVSDALQAARAGETDRGRLILETGLQRAAEEQAGGSAWGGALAAKYREALESYDRRHPAA